MHGCLCVLNVFELCVRTYKDNSYLRIAGLMYSVNHLKILLQDKNYIVNIYLLNQLTCHFIIGTCHYITVTPETDNTPLCHCIKVRTMFYIFHIILIGLVKMSWFVH